MVDKEQLIADSLEIKNVLTDTSAIDADIERLTGELEQISVQVATMVRDNARTAQDQEEYARRYDELAKRYESVKAAYDKASEVRAYKNSQALKMAVFIAKIENVERTISTWDSDIWNVLVESGVVHRDGTITFKFKSGREARV